MALEAHLRELGSKHKRLERQIEEAMAHPSVDDLEIAKLKREKLRLKDELLKAQAHKLA